ncbi:hypothetical protein [Streptomyces sp. NPDC002845]
MFCSNQMLGRDLFAGAPPEGIEPTTGGHRLSTLMPQSLYRHKSEMRGRASAVARPETVLA